METIYIVSLTKHRIDELLADYAAEALVSLGLDVVRDLPTTLAFNCKLLVFNGVKEDSIWCEKVIAAMSAVDSYYFIDDHTTWIPGVFCTVISQFSNLHPIHEYTKGWKYWPISRLGNLMQKYLGRPKYDFVYWGHYKEERAGEYLKYIPRVRDTLIIGNREDWPDEFHLCTFKPYERDMDKLYTLISGCKETTIFGDKYHNGNNLPLRYYEALKCGLKINIVSDLAERIGFKVDMSAEDLGKELCEVCDIELSQVMPFNPNHTTTNVDDILEQRGQIYGSYENGVYCRANIMNNLKSVYKDTHPGLEMPQNLQIMYGDLVLKLMRSASDPSHIDSWVDLAGYAKLIKEAMEEQDVSN